jgi:hypothetical protein
MPIKLGFYFMFFGKMSLDKKYETPNPDVAIGNKIVITFTEFGAIPNEFG